jgi:hypothetical protein
MMNLFSVAKRDDWKNLSKSNSKIKIPLQLVYTNQEFELIRQGFIPEVMENKWFVVVEDGHILFFRSWTGIMIYDCVFEEKGNEVWVSSIDVNRNLDEYLNTDNLHDVCQIKHLLDWVRSQNSL